MVTEFAAESVSKVTLLVDFTCNAFPVFNVDGGALVDMVDGDDRDEPAAVTAGGSIFGSDSRWCKGKSGVGGARLQLCIFGPLAIPKPSFLGSCKRGSISDFSWC